MNLRGRIDTPMIAAALAMMALPTEEYHKTDTPEEDAVRKKAIADKYREERLERKRINMEKRKPRKERK